MSSVFTSCVAQKGSRDKVMWMEHKEKEAQRKEGTLQHLRGRYCLSGKSCQFLSRNNLMLCKHSYRIFRFLRMLDYKYRRKGLYFFVENIIFIPFFLSRLCPFFHFVSLIFSHCFSLSPQLSTAVLFYFPHHHSLHPRPFCLGFSSLPFLLFPDKKLECKAQNCFLPSPFVTGNIHESDSSCSFTALTL